MSLLTPGANQFSDEIIDDLKFWGQTSLAATRISIAIMSQLTLPFELILHYNFGERHFTAGKVLLSCAAITAAWQLAFHTWVPLTIIKFMIFLVVCHWAWAVYRRRKGIRWHSRSPGLPWLLYVTPDRFVRKLGYRAYACEPLVLFVLGFIIWHWWVELGSFIMAGALIMFLQYNAMTRVVYKQALDSADAQIEQEHCADALRGEPPTETKGFMVPGVQRLSNDQRRAIEARIPRTLGDAEEAPAEVLPSEVDAGPNEEPQEHDDHRESETSEATPDIEAETSDEDNTDMPEDEHGPPEEALTPPPDIASDPLFELENPRDEDGPPESDSGDNEPQRR